MVQNLDQMKAIVAEARLTEAQAQAHAQALEAPQPTPAALPGSSTTVNGQQPFFRPFIAEQWS